MVRGGSAVEHAPCGLWHTYNTAFPGYKVRIEVALAWDTCRRVGLRGALGSLALKGEHPESLTSVNRLAYVCTSFETVGDDARPEPRCLSGTGLQRVVRGGCGSACRCMHALAAVAHRGGVAGDAVCVAVCVGGVIVGTLVVVTIGDKPRFDARFQRHVVRPLYRPAVLTLLCRMLLSVLHNAAASVQRRSSLTGIFPSSHADFLAQSLKPQVNHLHCLNYLHCSPSTLTCPVPVSEGEDYF